MASPPTSSGSENNGRNLLGDCSDELDSSSSAESSSGSHEMHGGGPLFPDQYRLTKPTTTTDGGQENATTSTYGEEESATTSKGGEEENATTSKDGGEENATTSKDGGEENATSSKDGGQENATASIGGEEENATALSERKEGNATTQEQAPWYANMICCVGFEKEYQKDKAEKAVEPATEKVKFLTVQEAFNTYPSLKRLQEKHKAGNSTSKQSEHFLAERFEEPKDPEAPQPWYESKKPVPQLKKDEKKAVRSRVKQSISELFEDHPSLAKLYEKMKGPMNLEIMDKYVRPFADLETRCDPTNMNRFISPVCAGRMAQLIEQFPEGVGVDHFLKVYKAFCGSFDLNGYDFPKDNDPNSTFKLPNIFWVPDNDECSLPSRIIFPRASADKYQGSLKKVLSAYWDGFLKFMEGKEQKCISDGFDAMNAELFYLETRIRFSFKRWDLPSYKSFFEILIDNFDPANKLWTVVRVHRKDEETDRMSLEPVVHVVSTKYGDGLVRQIQAEAAGTFGKKEEDKKVQPSLPPKEDATWRYADMNFVAMASIESSNRRELTVIAAGNIKKIDMFHVLHVKNVGDRDEVLKTVHETVIHTLEFSVPMYVQVGSVVIFKNEMGFWRRGLILEYHEEDGIVEALDVDTGELNRKIPVHVVRNITKALYDLPVYAIRARFSLKPDLKKVFMEDEDANLDLGKYLHMSLVDTNKGMLLHVHKIEAASFFGTAVCVVTGFLIDVVEKAVIQPQTYLPEVLVGKYMTRNPKEELPMWEDETIDGNWGDFMPCRSENLSRSFTRYEWHLEDYGVRIKLLSKEYGGPDPPLSMYVNQDHE